MLVLCRRTGRGCWPYGEFYFNFVSDKTSGIDCISNSINLPAGAIAGLAAKVDPNRPVAAVPVPKPPKPVPVVPNPPKPEGAVVVVPKLLPNKDGAAVDVLPNKPPPPKADAPVPVVPNRLGVEVVAGWPNKDGADVVVPKRLGAVLVLPVERHTRLFSIFFLFLKSLPNKPVV